MSPEGANHRQQQLLHDQDESHIADHEEGEDHSLITTANNATTGSPATSNNHIVNHNDPWKNRNVILVLIWSVVAGIADSIWSNTVLSGFLLALADAIHPTGKHNPHDNTLVGTAEAVQGMAMLLSALPVGLVADWFGKARIVAYGGVLIAFTIIITFVALWKAKLAVAGHNDDNENNNDNTSDDVLSHIALNAYYWMLAALALWGVGQGIVEGPSLALFADSIPKGQRSSLMTWQYSSYLISSVVGPIVGVMMLAHRATDESWSLTEIYPVFVVGVALEIPGVIIMFLFREKDTVVDEEGEEEREDSNEDRTAANASREQLPVSPNNDLETPLLDGEDNRTESLPTSSLRRLGKQSIPYVLFLASLVTALGSGASVKYFPLFFRELGFSSAFVQGIYIFVPLSISLLSFVAQRVSKSLGRIETTVLWELIGVSLLYYMTWLSRDEAEMSDFQKYEIIVVYLLRTGLMNAGYPLLESVLMDAIPSNQRARWKSLESIAAFGWTGSALVGGVLADDRSYRFTFAITATLQLAGTLILIPLQPFVEPEDHVDDAEAIRSQEQDP